MLHRPAVGPEYNRSVRGMRFSLRRRSLVAILPLAGLQSTMKLAVGIPTDAVCAGPVCYLLLGMSLSAVRRPGLCRNQARACSIQVTIEF